MTQIESHLRLDGVEVDDLTHAFIKLAVTPEESERVNQTLGAFFRDSRSRLNDLKIALYLAKRSSQSNPETSWTDLTRTYFSLEQLISRVQMICQPVEISTSATDLSILLNQRRATWALWLETESHSFVWQPPDQPVVSAIDAPGLIEGLDALVEWRASDAPPGTLVRFSWWEHQGTIRLVWDETPAIDEGPLASTAISHPSLALPVLARVVAAHCGELRLTQRQGFSLEIEWPRRQAKP